MASDEEASTKTNINESVEPSPEEETQDKAEFIKGYCLYKHDSSSLSLLKTDLEPEQEAKLQDFLIKRLSRSVVYNGNGNLATLSSTDISIKPVTCYYKLIKGTKPNEQSAENDDDIDNNDSQRSTDFLVCFVVSETSNLHLFQQELENFCKHFESTLMLRCDQINQPGIDDISQFLKDLGNWYDLNILYVCRCTNLFKLDLASLINVGLRGVSLDVEGCESSVKGDIYKFVAACSLSGLLSTPAEKESNHKLLEEMQIFESKQNAKLTFSGSEFKFEMSEVCEVCKDWATIMAEGELNDPVFLKQVMENYKLKVIQDMNSLKRLLMEARTDHYALYRSYTFLSKCHSSQIVMEHIKQEMENSLTKDMFSIVQVLEEFITEKGGFKKIRKYSETL